MPAATVDAGLADALRARLAGDAIGPGDAAVRAPRGAASTRGPTRARGRSPAARRATTSSPRWPWPRTAGSRSRSAAGGTSDRGAGDGALVLDLSPMDGIEVDAAARTARVGAGGHLGGARRGDPAARARRHGRAGLAPRRRRRRAGRRSGWLERALGPTGASLAGAELVLADGRVLEVGEAEAPELLWALRGAGARLGVVTRLDLRLHPVGPVLLCGFLGFPRDRAREVAAPTRTSCARRRDAVGGGLLLGAGRGGACSIVFCHAGTVEDGRGGRRAAARAAARRWTPWRRTTTAPSRRMWDAGNPPGAHVHVRGGYLARAVGRRPGRWRSRRRTGPRPRSPTSSCSRSAARSRAPSPGELALRIPDAPWAYRCVGLWPPVPALEPGRRRGSTASPRRWRRTPSTRASPSLAEPGPDGLVRAYGRDGSDRLRALARDLGVALSS